MKQKSIDLHFKWKFLKNLHAYLLPYEDKHIITVVWLDQFWRIFCPFGFKLKVYE